MIFLSIGSNLDSKFGSRFDNINKILFFLNQEGVKVIKTSSFYETPSYPNNKFPKFINIAAQVFCKITYLELLKIISNIEKKIGRVKKIKNDPRPCDIDIIDFNGLVKKTNIITLPHPRAFERNFVLFPLKEICPNWRNPSNNKKIDDLIRNISFKLRNEITTLSESGMLVK